MKKLILLIGTLISVSLFSQNLDRLEYFFDTDPGYGAGISVDCQASPDQNIDFNVDVSELGNGLHKLGIRSADVDGRWSLTSWQVFQKETISSLDPYPAFSRIEYFLNIDPGYGLGQSIDVPSDTVIDIESILDISTVSNGLHRLGIRSQDVHGRWSLTYQTVFLKETIVALDDAPDIVALEYFIDADPGFGAGTNVPLLASSEVDHSFVADVSGLPLGFHRFYLRARNASGNWSLFSISPLVIENNAPHAINPQVVSIDWTVYDDTSGVISIGSFDDFEPLADLDLLFDAMLEVMSPDQTYTFAMQGRDNQGMRSLPVYHDFQIQFLNSPPVRQVEIADQLLQEDFGEVIVANLDTIFLDLDVPERDSLSYSLISDDTVLIASLDSCLLKLESIPERSGTTTLFLTATDDSLARAFDTLQVIVNPVNDPLVMLNSIPDLVLDEDVGPYQVVNLYDNFSDIDNPILEFTASTPEEHLLVMINDSLLVVQPDTNWSGSAMVEVVATDGEYSLADTFLVIVRSVNDPPIMPIALHPLGNVEMDSTGYFIWFLSEDLESGMAASYQLQVDDTTSFSSPEIDQHDLGLNNLLSLIRTSLGTETRELRDTAFAVQLGSLMGFSSLRNDDLYYWRLRAMDVGDTHSVWTAEGTSFWFNPVNDAPSRVNSGFTPADNQAVGSIFPTIAWNAAQDPDWSDPHASLVYNLQMTEEEDFTLAFVDTLTAPGSNSFDAYDLSDDTQYFYRVKTIDDEGVESEWSNTQRFITNTALDPPGPFALVFPPDSTNGLEQTFQFNWQPALDPDLFDVVTYNLYVSADSTFISNVFEQLGLESPEFQLSESLPDNSIYWWKVEAIDTDSLMTNSAVWSFVVGTVNIDFVELPTEFFLQQNFPNPFNPTTTIRYALPEQSAITLTIFDVQGRIIKTIIPEAHSPGWYEQRWDGSDASGNPTGAGIYFCRLTAGSFHQVIKMIYLK